MWTKTIRRALLRFVYTILPPLEARPANRRLLAQWTSEQSTLGSTDQRYLTWFNLPTDTLESQLKAEDERASAIEDKAAKIAVALGIGLTIGGTIGKSLADAVHQPSMKVGILSALFVSMLYLMWGGWKAYRGGMGTAGRMGVGPDWAVFVSRSPKTACVTALVHFEKMNIIRNNNLSVALDCVRNGLIIFAIMVLVVLADLLGGAVTSGKPEDLNSLPTHSQQVTRLPGVWPQAKDITCDCGAYQAREILLAHGKTVPVTKLYASDWERKRCSTLPWRFDALLEKYGHLRAESGFVFTDTGLIGQTVRALSENHPIILLIQATRGHHGLHWISVWGYDAPHHEFLVYDSQYPTANGGTGNARYSLSLLESRLPWWGKVAVDVAD